MSYFQDLKKTIEIELPQNSIKALKKAVELTDNIFKVQLKEGVYPESLNKEDFLSQKKENPQLMSALTVVKKTDESLTAIPYHKEYRSYIEKIASYLEQARQELQKEDRAFSDFLKMRKEALLTDKYNESDVYWLGMDSDLDLQIGPIERYSDKIFGIKKFYSGVLSKKSEHNKDRINNFLASYSKIKNSFPVKQKIETGQSSPRIEIREVIAWGGEVAKLDASGWSRPDNPEIVQNHGTKKLIFKNILDRRVEERFLPLFENYFSEYLKGDFKISEMKESIFDALWSHEIGHSFLKYSNVKEKFDYLNTPLEEAKATILALEGLRFLRKKENLSEREYRANIAGTILNELVPVKEEEANSPTAKESHALAGKIILGKFCKEEIITLDEEGEINIDFSKFEEGFPKLVEKICYLYEEGSFKEAQRFVKETTDEYKLLS